jgi:ABC-type lipoprotein release transport system permease subunit
MLNFRRSVFAYGAFAISIALLVALSSLVTTAASYDLSIAKYGQGSDIQVWVNAPPRFADYLKTVEGVKNAAAVGYIGYAQNNMSFNGHYMHGKGILLTGVDSTDYFDVSYGVHLTSTLNGMSSNDVFNVLINESDNVILQDALAKKLSAEVGDEVTWLFTNQTGTSEKKLRVLATTDSVAGSSETIYNSASASGYYMAILRFQDMVPFRDAAVAGSNVDLFYVSVESGANMTQVADGLSQLCKQHGYTPTIYTVQQRITQTQTSYAQAETLSLSIMGFFIVVGGIGIAAAMAYIVYERKREIGLLFAVGLDRRQNFIIIAGEALLLALIGTAVGFASGFSLSLLTVHSIQWWSSISAPLLVISPLALTAAAVTITISAVLSAVYPANRVSKLNVAEAIRK